MLLLGRRGASPLLLVLHVTPTGRVLADKQGLEGRLYLLPKDGTLLLGLQGLERVPHADGKAALGILHVLGQPPALQAWDCFPCHGRLRGPRPTGPTPPCSLGPDSLGGSLPPGKARAALVTAPMG